jgi:hypothetical protein
MLSPQGNPMTPIDLFDQIIAASSPKYRLAAIGRFKASRAHLPRKQLTMPPFDWRPRKSLTELRPRHLHMVEEYGIEQTYDRDALGEHFLANWSRLFGPLRRTKAREVPSD